MGDELTSCRPNWDRLDKSQGAIWVAPDVIPDSSLLYEGAIVAERQTGKVWRAERDLNGRLVRKWIKYPWVLTGFTNFDVPYNFTLTAEQAMYGCVNLNLPQCKNAGPADVDVNQRLITPIAGIYEGVFLLSFNNTALYDQRYVTLLINGNNDSNNYDNYRLGNQYYYYTSMHCIRFNLFVAAGTGFSLSVRHNGGGAIPTTGSFIMTCVRPT
jgi:hypothetical protein